jgi:3-oxoacyl-[acyl-carrier protein] reductase
MSTIYAVYGVKDLMVKQNWGRIIASTSISVKQPLDNLILSNVSRAGVVAFIKSVSNALAPFNITANVVAPGYTMTERVENLLKARVEKEGITFEEAQKAMVASIPMKRIGTVEEFASTVAFLASEKASYITGVVLPIDGGFIKGV